MVLTCVRYPETGVGSFIERSRVARDGLYREIAPPRDLAAYVACGWTKVVPQGPDGDAPIPIIPDGCADIMTYDDGPPFVVGPDPVTRFTSLHPGLVITGLRLRPGAVRAVLGCSAGELLGESALLSDLFPDTRSLRSELDGSPTLALRLARLEAWVRARLASSMTDRSVVEACRVVSSAPRIGMDDLAGRFGWSPRTLHRSFVAACGYGPKYLQRIMRVQGVIRSVRGDPGRRLAEIASALGFADQAHMNRDFRSITGFAPTEYLGHTDAELGRWIDEEWSSQER